MAVTVTVHDPSGPRQRRVVCFDCGSDRVTLSFTVEGRLSCECGWSISYEDWRVQVTAEEARLTRQRRQRRRRRD